MGQPKASLPFGETTALGLILETCQEAGLRAALVIAGADEVAVRAAAAPFANARIVMHIEWNAGRTSSIKAGLAALGAVGDRPVPDDVLLWPVDCCLPGRDVIQALQAARAAHPQALAWIPSCAQRRGHPALLSPVAAARIAALGPDESARRVIHALADEGSLFHVDVHDPSVLMNMNTPEDYTHWLHAYASASTDSETEGSP
jgi:CTP:molybdopterin cytidylyltransferase MocA